MQPKIPPESISIKYHDFQLSTVRRMLAAVTDTDTDTYSQVMFVCFVGVKSENASF